MFSDVELSAFKTPAAKSGKETTVYHTQTAAAILFARNMLKKFNL
jgi:hypothetical protein